MKVDMLPRATRTVNAEGAWIDTHGVDELSVFTRVYAAPTGTTPGLITIVEDSPDQDAVSELGRTASITAAGTTSQRFAQFARWVRARVELTGTTPSFDVAVIGETSTS